MEWLCLSWGLFCYGNMSLLGKKVKGFFVIEDFCVWKVLFICRSSVIDDGFFVVVVLLDDVDYFSFCLGNIWGFVIVLFGVIVLWICVWKVFGGVLEVVFGLVGRLYWWLLVVIGKFRRFFDGVFMYLKNVFEKIWLVFS